MRPGVPGAPVLTAGAAYRGLAGRRRGSRSDARSCCGRCAGAQGTNPNAPTADCDVTKGPARSRQRPSERRPIAGVECSPPPPPPAPPRFAGGWLQPGIGAPNLGPSGGDGDGPNSLPPVTQGPRNEDDPTPPPFFCQDPISRLFLHITLLFHLPQGSAHPFACTLGSGGPHPHPLHAPSVSPFYPSPCPLLLFPTLPLLSALPLSRLIPTRFLFSQLSFFRWA